MKFQIVLCCLNSSPRLEMAPEAMPRWRHEFPLARSRPLAASRRCRSRSRRSSSISLSFGSQVLLSAPVTARMSVVPFALVQAVLIWLWIVLHAQRLHDAGRSAGLAVGIAIVYALEVVLLTIMVWLILQSTATTGGGAGSDATILQLFVILYLLTLLSRRPHARRAANLAHGFRRR